MMLGEIDWQVIWLREHALVPEKRDTAQDALRRLERSVLESGTIGCVDVELAMLRHYRANQRGWLYHKLSEQDVGDARVLS
jgi:hypothetical protein